MLFFLFIFFYFFLDFVEKHRCKEVAPKLFGFAFERLQTLLHFTLSTLHVSNHQTMNIEITLCCSNN